MRRIPDLIGQRFNRWLVIRRSDIPTKGNGAYGWICKCDCGTVRTVRHRGLTEGTSQSCGCLRSELNTKKHTIHGHKQKRSDGKHRGTSEYAAWRSMKE